MSGMCRWKGDMCMWVCEVLSSFFLFHSFSPHRKGFQMLPKGQTPFPSQAFQTAKKPSAEDDCLLVPIWMNWRDCKNTCRTFLPFCLDGGTIDQRGQKKSRRERMEGKHRQRNRRHSFPSFEGWECSALPLSSPPVLFLSQFYCVVLSIVARVAYVSPFTYIFLSRDTFPCPSLGKKDDSLQSFLSFSPLHSLQTPSGVLFHWRIFSPLAMCGYTFCPSMNWSLFLPSSHSENAFSRNSLSTPPPTVPSLSGITSWWRFLLSSPLSYLTQGWELLVLSRLKWDLAAITPNDFVNPLLRRLSPWTKGKETIIKRHTQTFIALCAAGEFILLHLSLWSNVCVIPSLCRSYILYHHFVFDVCDLRLSQCVFVQSLSLSMLWVFELKETFFADFVKLHTPAKETEAM